MDIVDLYIDDWGRLVLVRGSGEQLPGIVPVRCFPFEEPSRYISLCDEHGHEVEILDHLDALPEAPRAILQAELVRTELVPIVHRILSISPGAEPTVWEVETSHGRTDFILHSEDDVRRLGEGVLIIDDRGLRFHIPDERTLDPHSRKFLRRYF